MEFWIIAIAVWLLCAVGAAGMAVAFYQGRFPNFAKEEYRRDLAFGCFLGIFGGPIALFLLFFMTGFCEYGWSLKRRA